MYSENADLVSAFFLYHCHQNLRMYKVLLLATGLLLTVAACTPIPQSTRYTQTEKIAVGYGPEDIDINPESKELFVSCNARRKKEPYQGDIYLVDTQNADQTIKLNREDEPEGFVFNPHGIYFMKNGEGEWLYVISHDDEADVHSVYLYEYTREKLYFKRAYNHPLLVSPNALAVQRNGSFFVSNDAGKRGDYKEVIFKKKRSKIIYCDGKDNWKVAADKIVFANGIALKGNTAYVATTAHKALFQYRIVDGKLVDRKVVASIQGLDNIRFDGDDLIVPAHPRNIAFVRHFGNSKNLSPSVIYRISPEGKSEVIYSDKGKQISAAATGLILDGQLYISQVFDPFLLKVDLSTLEK